MNSFEIKPTEENLIVALKEDLLKRNQEIVHFYNLLLSQETISTIAIDGKWGSGKTFFVKQTMMVINAKNPMSIIDEEKKAEITYKLPFAKNVEDDTNYDLAIYYDAWENDNDTEPVLSIIYEITKQLGLSYAFSPKTNVFKVAGDIIEAISGRNVNGIIENLNSDNPLTKFKEQKELEEKIRIFFNEVLIERGNRLVVFIDELDRCKPSFAVHLLEQLKHYFDDERITFVFSVNLEELQHTIKHYYGAAFDACRYLDRFFDLRISLPPADRRAFYDKMGLSGSYALEKVAQRFIDVYGLELREITRYYRQLRSAVYVPTHDNQRRWDFSFGDGKARQFMLMCIVPILVGLKIVDISTYEDFISGRNGKPMVDVFNTKNFVDWFFSSMLKQNESFEQGEGKIMVTPEKIILDVYNAIFANDYSGSKYREKMGEYEFDTSSKKFVLAASSMLSAYADFSI